MNIHRPGNCPVGVNGRAAAAGCARRNRVDFMLSSFPQRTGARVAPMRFGPTSFEKGTGPTHGEHFIISSWQSVVPTQHPCYSPVIRPVPSLLFSTEVPVLRAFLRFFKSFLFLQGFTGRGLRRRKLLPSVPSPATEPDTSRRFSQTNPTDASAELVKSALARREPVLRVSTGVADARSLQSRQARHALP
jgi:hypothetical protein